MANRSKDWLKQAEADLRHARNSITLEDFEWACFSAQQAAEKAVKAVCQQLHAEAWGHSVSRDSDDSVVVFSKGGRGRLTILRCPTAKLTAITYKDWQR